MTVDQKQQELPPEAAQDLLDTFRNRADPKFVRALEGFPNANFSWARRLAWLNDNVLPKLMRGDLAAWAREGSPLGTWLYVPATAWRALWLDSRGGPRDENHLGTASGPGVELFDVRIGSRASRDASGNGIDKRNCRPHGSSFEKIDAPIVERMNCLIAGGKVPSPTAAVKMLLNDGVEIMGASPEAKVSRLVKLYKATEKNGDLRYSG